MKKILIITILLASVSVLGFSQTTFAVRNTATWVDAVGGIRNGGNDKAYTLTVTGNFSVPSTSTGNTFGSVTGVTIIIEGSGTLSLSANGCLLNIGDGQTVVVRDLTLRGRSDNGNYSLVGIISGGTFRMEGKASVTGNIINGRGGGVYVDSDGTFTMQGNTQVSGNTGSNGGGGVYVNEKGTFTMQDSAQVSGNTASSGGGGVYINGTFTMQDNAQVSGNTASSGGGGVYVNEQGTFTMKDSALVLRNTSSTSLSNNFWYPSYSSGGVYVNGGTFIMQGGTISGNTATSSGYASGSGGGVFSAGRFTMEGGTISGNTSTSLRPGGGVYVHNGTFAMKGGAISGNTATSFNSDAYYNDSITVAPGSGGGVYTAGTFTMHSGTISNNTATSSGRNTSGSGGGVYVGGSRNSDGTFTMQSGTISDNTGAIGGGVYVNSGTFTMGGGTISGNTAGGSGGGVWVYRNFAKTGGTIYGDDADQKLKNTAISGKGHAVYENENKGWRNASAGQTMNPDSYGFWLNEEAVVSGFSFNGTWKRSNFNNTLTFTATTVKSSSRDNTWNFISASGNSYTLESNTAAKTRMTLTIRHDNNNLEISGDSGNGENNWNGTWRKQ